MNLESPLFNDSATSSNVVGSRAVLIFADCVALAGIHRPLLGVWGNPENSTPRSSFPNFESGALTSA